MSPANEYRTPRKESPLAETDEESSTTSPQSFVPLMQMIRGDDGVANETDDASLTSDHQSVDGMAEFEEICTIEMDVTPPRSEKQRDSYSDSQSSSDSHKTNRTGSTHSLSLNLSQSFLTCTTNDHGNSAVPEDEDHLHTRRSAAWTPRQSISRRSSELEFFDDLVSEPVLVLGVDISHLDRKMQFIVCATGVFGFSLLYGYLQELISVQICNRQLGLFLAMMQFTGYTVLSFILRTYVYETHQKKSIVKKQKEASGKVLDIGGALTVPFLLYLGLSLLRAVDLGMTNVAMQYINYPAKTLLKSSRVVFTMIFGVLISRKRYLFMDYFVVLCMVAGLAIFMHADATSSAVFQPIGVIMLTISLLCDGAISNMSESIMKNYGVGQDEFIFRMYSIALVAITAAAAVKGDLQLGMAWMMQPGTYDEMQQGVSAEEATWSVMGKAAVVVLFSSMGFFGSSCSAAITKNFGALTMSITSTARKATTLFLSFFLFNNVCTLEHIVGVVIFIVALTVKSLRRRNDSARSATPSKMKDCSDIEMQMGSQHGMYPVSKAVEHSPPFSPKRMRRLERRVSLSPNGKHHGTTPERRRNSVKVAPLPFGR